MNDKPLAAARALLVLAALAAPSGARAGDPPSGGAAPTLTLAGAMQRAREKAREVVAAEARRQAAEARADQARALRLPSLNLTELWMRTNNPAEVFALRLNQGTFSFPEFVASDPNDAAPLDTGITRAEVVLPLFTGGELSGRIDQAKLAAASASGTSAWVADNAALAAAEAYVMLAQAEEYAALLGKSRDTVAAHVGLARDYVTQGMLVRSDLLRAEVELARMDDLVTEAEGRVRVADASLAFRMGADVGSSWTLAPLPVPRPVEEPVDGWLGTAAGRADLGSARSLLAAGELEEKVRKAPLWPKIALVARGELYGDKPFGSTGTSGSIMAVATWNVFQGGADRAAAAAAREETRAGREDVARFAEGVRLEVRQAWEEARTAETRHDTATKALAAAREAERITEERFRAGIVKTLDLLDVTTARREAETRELVARAEAHAAALRLAVKAGRRPETALNGDTQ
ncbi:MAG TPA: TolC family protein [Thermoanaerobaculia bacterium]|nr:TolC family protein [Thermoanaerobaculia bacterium]